jgi:prolyl-tRNA synthetase
VVGPWAGSADDEARIKDDTKATLRCMPLEQPESVGPCFFTDQPAKGIAYFARAY